MPYRFVAELPTSPLLFIEHCKDTKKVYILDIFLRFLREKSPPTNSKWGNVVVEVNYCRFALKFTDVLLSLIVPLISSPFKTMFVYMM